MINQKTDLLKNPEFLSTHIVTLDTDSLLDNARASLGSYCMTVCKAKCCNKGKLLLSQKEAIMLTKRLSHPQLTKRDDGCFDLSLAQGCPSLKGSACGVYSQRPKMCRDYPIFDRGLNDTRRIVFASSCEGNEIGLLQAYKEELLRRGLKVEDF